MSENSPEPGLSPKRRQYLSYLLGYAAFAVGLALIVGTMHDYSSYKIQWEFITLGQDPWIAPVGVAYYPDNAYGPLHAAMAPIWATYKMLPKIVFALMTVAICGLLMRTYPSAGHELNPKRFFWLLALFGLSPLVVIAVLLFGNNDIFPALCMILAATQFADGRRNSAGIWIGLGALMKFYPLLFAGFLMSRNDGRLDLRVPVTALAVFVAGMLLAYLFWGPSVLEPFQFGSDRGAKMLSILRFVWSFENLRDAPLVQHLLAANSLYVLAIATLVSLHGWLARIAWQITLLVGILGVFAVYKVGHPQFFVTWLAVWAWIMVGRRDSKPWRVARAFLPVAVFLSAYQSLYLLSNLLADAYFKGDWAVFRVYASPVFLATILWCVWRVRGDLFRRWQRPSGLRF